MEKVYFGRYLADTGDSFFWGGAGRKDNLEM